jgi:DNA polymerase III subunit delta'
LEIPASDPVFSRVASGGHSEFLTIERLYDAGKDRYKNTVEVDEVRKVAPFLRKTAAEGGWRIVIVDDADTMNRNAQNALLKILEEPPANTLLILVTHRAGALIPTIRSRAQTLNFDPLTPQTFRALLEKQGQALSAEELSTIRELSRGSFGKALQLLEADGLAMAGRILDLLETAPRLDWLAIHKFTDSHANTEEGFELFADITNAIFRELAKVRARGAEITGFGVHKPMLQEFLARFSLPQLLSVADSLQSHFLKLQTANLDRRQGAITAFSLIS